LVFLFKVAIYKEQKVGLDTCANRLDKQNVTNLKRSISITKIFKLGFSQQAYLGSQKRFSHFFYLLSFTAKHLAINTANISTIVKGRVV